MDASCAENMIEDAESTILELDGLGYDVSYAQKFMKLAKAFYQQKSFEKAYEYAKKAYDTAKAIEKAKEEESLRDLKDAYEGNKISAEELEHALSSSTRLGGPVIVEKKNENKEVMKDTIENTPNNEQIDKEKIQKIQHVQLEKIPEKSKPVKKLKKSDELKVIEYSCKKKKD